MKREIRKLIAEYDKKYANTTSSIREELYSDDTIQILNMVEEQVGYPITPNEVMFYTILTTWKAGIIVGAKRKKTNR